LTLARSAVVFRPRLLARWSFNGKPSSALFSPISQRRAFGEVALEGMNRLGRQDREVGGRPGLAATRPLSRELYAGKASPPVAARATEEPRLSGNNQGGTAQTSQSESRALGENLKIIIKPRK
jgi:hypothetical protein